MLDKILNFINDHIVHLYWNTLLTYKKSGKWWQRGGDGAIIITTACTLKCIAYCPMFISDDKYPKFKVSTFEEWKNFIEHFPVWMSQIYITGGEPTLVPYISELINWLVDRGHHVTLFTNLANPERLYGVKNHWRFTCIPTFHPEYDDRKRYEDAYFKLKGRFRVDAQEMEEKRLFSFSKYKKKFSTSWFLHENHKFHFAPDSPRTGKVYLGCNKVYIDGK